MESLAACHDPNSKLVIYFTVNTAFVNYLDQIGNLTDSLEFPILKNKTIFEQIQPTSLNISKFDSELLKSPRNLKDFIHQYNLKEIFDLNERPPAVAGVPLKRRRRTGTAYIILIP